MADDDNGDGATEGSGPAEPFGGPGCGPGPFGSFFKRKLPPRVRDADLARDLGTVLDGSGRVVLVGVGYELHLADSLGLFVLWAIRDTLAGGGEEDPSGRFLFLMAGAVPENMTGAIRGFGATHAVFVDAAALGEEYPPGSGLVIPPEAVEDTALATHGMPLTIVCDFLRASAGVTPVVLGIQAPDLTAGELDGDTRRRMAEVVQTVAAVLRDLPGGRPRGP